MGAMIGAALGGSLTDGFIQGYTKRKEYQKQKDFIVMRYRWAVRDMKKAGLNPILAAGQSQPIGSAPDLGVDTDFAGALTSAMQMRLQKKAVESQVDKNEADAASANEDARAKKALNDLTIPEQNITRSMDIRFPGGPPIGDASSVKDVGPSLLRQRYEADIERTRSSAVSNRARARYDDAMAALGPVRQREIENAIANRNLDDLKKAWMSLGGQAISTFAEFLAAYGIKKTPAGVPPRVPRPRVGF